jgi:hypothetical protein
MYTGKDGFISVKPDVNGVYRLGNPIGFNLANQIKVLQLFKANAAANKANIQAMDIICGARKDGATYQAITDKLNGLGYTTRYVNHSTQYKYKNYLNSIYIKLLQ